MKSFKIIAIIPVSTATVFISNLYSAADVIGRAAEGSIFGILRLFLCINFKSSQEVERRYLTEQSAIGDEQPSGKMKMF